MWTRSKAWWSTRWVARRFFPPCGGETSAMSIPAAREDGKGVGNFSLRFRSFLVVESTEWALGELVVLS